MFENAGEKIKVLATVSFWIVTAISVILGLFFISTSVGIFFAMIIGGPCCAYCSSLVLAGFGELVENSSSVRAAQKVLVELNKDLSKNSNKPKEESGSQDGQRTWGTGKRY